MSYHMDFSIMKASSIYDKYLEMVFLSSDTFFVLLKVFSNFPGLHGEPITRSHHAHEFHKFTTVLQNISLNNILEINCFVERLEIISFLLVAFQFVNAWQSTKGIIIFPLFVPITAQRTVYFSKRQGIEMYFISSSTKLGYDILGKEF